jgi:hypothetical protein
VQPDGEGAIHGRPGPRPQYPVHAGDRPD